MEGPTNCNRACVYCDVHKRKNTVRFSTVAESLRQVDWAYDEGFLFFQYVGGEPLAGCQFDGGVRPGRYQMCLNGANLMYEDFTEKLTSFTTEEGKTYVDHALEIIGYASRLGMFTNVITNGDFLDNTYYLSRLKKARLDFLTFSLHSPTEAGIRSIIGKARATANAGIIPTVSVVFTADRADIIPKVAKTCAANGIFFSTSIVQEIGDGFSTVPEKSNIPTLEQIEKVARELEPLRKSGFLVNGWNYFVKAMDSNGSRWKCDPTQDQFIHIRAQGEKGELGVCSEMRTGLDTGVSLKSKEWRERKEGAVDGCPGCLYSCYFRCQNPDFRGDSQTLMPMVLIKSGHSGLARKLGRRTIKDPSEIISVPQSELEKSQSWLKNYDRLHNRLKRKGKDLIDIASAPFVLAAVLATYVFVSLAARRKGISQDKVNEYMLMSIVYGGIVELGKDEKNDEMSDSRS
ncbi:radical SAM protein [Candidatus Daviesbacteria bacterium]|nr:radical SAM protein [Candidatus Daviesbacteria bacterium]